MGAALLASSTQVIQLFGIKDVPEANGVLGVIKFYGCMLPNLVHINWATFITSCICIIALVIVKEFIEPRFKKRFNLPIPTELFVIIIATVTFHFGKLNSRYGVNTVGEIPRGLRAPRLPKFSLLPSLIPYAISTGIVAFSLAISMGKLFAKKHNYEINPNQELFALGTSQVVSSFFWCHCGGTSLSRSLVQEQSGAKTQIASIIAAVIILVVLLALGPLFNDLPTCALAAIIIVNLKGMFLQFRKLPPLWRQSKVDFCIWVVSVSAVVLLDIGLGLLVSIVFALLTVVFRSQWPYSVSLGQMPGMEIYKELNGYENVAKRNAVKIFRFDSHLYFANVDLFKAELSRETEIDIVREKKRLKKKLVKGIDNDSIFYCNGVRAIVIDCSACPYADMMGLQALKQVYEDYSSTKINVALACVNMRLRQMMETSAFFKQVPESALYPLVHDAVLQLSTPTNTEVKAGSVRFVTERF